MASRARSGRVPRRQPRGSRGRRASLHAASWRHVPECERDRRGSSPSLACRRVSGDLLRVPSGTGRRGGDRPTAGRPAPTGHRRRPGRRPVAHHGGCGEHPGSATVVLSQPQTSYAQAIPRTATSKTARRAFAGGQRCPVRKCTYVHPTRLNNTVAVVYVDARRASRPVEAWVPVKVGDGERQVRADQRFAYFSDRKSPTVAKCVIGTLLYAFIAAFLLVVIAVVRRARFVAHPRLALRRGSPRHSPRAPRSRRASCSLPRSGASAAGPDNVSELVATLPRVRLTSRIPGPNPPGLGSGGTTGRLAE